MCYADVATPGVGGYRDEAWARAVGAVKDYAHLAQLGGGDREVVKVVLDIIVGAVERGLPASGGFRV